MKKKTVTTNWFVEPLNPFTNEVIAKELAKTADIVESVKLKINDGSVHAMYQVPSYHIISQLDAGKKQFSLKYKVYSRTGINAQIRIWNFG
ncbi:MAG: hypothetical protein PHE20_00085 [Patescibacteria group bacterium]|nr:hypothetical protein [Patescibacteria group bacterium]